MTVLRFDGGGPWPLGRFPGLSELPGISHAVTSRDGPDFGTVGTTELTAQGSAALATAMGLAGAAWAHQVHGGNVLVVDRPGLSGEADALATDRPGLLLCGRSADCPLILVAGRASDGRAVVGVAHASWRSTVAGIATNLLAVLTEELGAATSSFRAAIAPSAGPCCYEVGREVRAAALAALGPGAADCFRPHGDRWIFDLWLANADQLVAAGLDPERLEISGICTICRGERFWSWRVQREQAGRFTAAIGISAG